MKLVKQIVPYDMAHNSETDCTDLLMEIERLDLLIDAVDVKAHKKVCLYLRSCVPYAPDPENVVLMRTALEIYRKHEKYCDAMRIALQLNDDDIIVDIFIKCPDLTMKKQLCYILGRQQRYIEFPDDMEDTDELQEIISNRYYSLITLIINNLASLVI